MKTRNPLLRLPAGERMADLPPEAKAALVELLSDLAMDANRMAELSWNRRKGPMAAYWRAVCTYAKHTRAAVRRKHNR